MAEQLSLSEPRSRPRWLASGSGSGSAIDELINGNTGIQVSSVDNADTETGQIIVAQALSYLLAGHKPAAYGVCTGAGPEPGAHPVPDAVVHPVAHVVDQAQERGVAGTQPVGGRTLLTGGLAAVGARAAYAALNASGRPAARRPGPGPTTAASR